MKRILIILIAIGLASTAKAQFPTTDSLRAFVNRFIRNSAIEAFQNLRLNTALIGMTNFVDSAYGGQVLSFASLNDSTARLITIGGDTFDVVIRGNPPSITLNNIGTGYALLATPGGNIKRINNNYGILIDSTTTSNTITIRADTSSTNHLVTQSDLNDGLATKLNSSDTANKWINDLRRRPGTDTVEKFKNGSWQFAYIDSIGSGGGSSPTAGYGIGVSGSQVRIDTPVVDNRYVKRFFVTDPSLPDPATTDSSSHDDCPAIKATIQRAYDAGGGIVYFPLGHYTIGCALQHSVDGVDPDAQIVLPLARDTASKKVRITFEGEAQGNWSAELVTVRPKVKYGVILESTILDTGYVFGSSFYTDGSFGGDINWNWWGFKNIEIRVRTKTSGSEINNVMSGINSEAPRSVNFDHVKVTVQSSEGNMLEPSSWTIGVKLPHWNNNGNVVINNLNVSGYYNGVIAAEHMNATELITFNCHNGLYLPYAFHSGYIGKYTSEGCVNHIFVSNETGPFTGGPLDLHIGSFNVEHYTVAAQWNTYSADVTYADTSSPSRLYISYAHMAESGVGKVSTFNTNAPQRVTIGLNGVNGASDFLKDNGQGGYVMNRAASTTVDNNILKLGSTAQTGGFIFGSTSIFDYSSGPHIGARGNTYSAFSNQRGMLFIAGGQVSSPTGNEGSLLFQTQNINRMIVGYNGAIRMPYLTKSSSTTDSALYPNPSTGDLELRPIAGGGGGGGTLQDALDNGRTGDTIVIASSSGTNRDIQLYNENAGVDDLAVFRISGRGTNAGSLLNIIPKNAGFSGIQSQVGIWNTSDEANPELLQIRATGTGYNINAYQDASGSIWPIRIQMDGSDAISIATNKAVTFNSAFTFPIADGTNGQVLQTNGSGTVSWQTPSSATTIYSGDGTLAGDRTISTGGNTLSVTGSNDSETSFSVTNNGSTAASAIAGTVTGSNGAGVTGTSSAGNGVVGSSTSSYGVVGTSSSSAAFRGQINVSSNNDIQNIVALLRTSSSGAGANGLGAAIQYELETATNGTSQTAGRVAFLWSDATDATRTSRFEIYGVNSGTTARKAALAGNGQWTWDGYGSGTHTGTPTGSLQTTSSGDIIEGPALAAGTYTPTLTAVTNTSSPLLDGARYTRIGNVVTFSLRFSVTTSSGSSASSIRVTLPVASSFNNINQAAGTCSGSLGRVESDATNDELIVAWTSGVGGSETIVVTGQYTIL